MRTLATVRRVDTQSVLVCELIGMIFIILLGSLLHFTFEISGRNPMVGAFSAVNESVWAHLKLSFWPALVYASVEYGCLSKKTTGIFFPAKVVGIYLMPTRLFPPSISTELSPMRIYCWTF